MKDFVCKTCDYLYKGNKAPEKCPQCETALNTFEAIENKDFDLEEINILGIGKNINENIIESLRENFIGECTEVGMYIAMAKQAEKEGYPEIAQAFEKIAFEEAEHAGKFAEILGEVLEASTENNLRIRAAAEYGAYEGKKIFSKKLKKLNLDAIYYAVYGIYNDEARHGKIFQSLLNRYFAD